MVSVILFVAGCADISIPLPEASPSFQFTKEEPQSGILAFSVVCIGLYGILDADIIDVKTDKINNFSFSCFPQEGYNQIKILKIPAGYYTLGKVSYFDGHSTHYTIEKNHFYFTIQAHKVNYIGRIHFTVNRDRLITGVDNDDIADIPQIKRVLPELPPKSYIVLFWEKDEFGDVIAKSPTSIPVLPEKQEKDISIDYEKYKTIYSHHKPKS